MAAIFNSILFIFMFAGRSHQRADHSRMRAYKIYNIVDMMTFWEEYQLLGPLALLGEAQRDDWVMQEKPS